MNELIPDWKEKEAPLRTQVTSDTMKILSETSSITMPSIFMPKSIDNHGNYIISLSELCMWLNEQAEEMGVEILPGFSGESVIENSEGQIAGVVTGSFGIAKDGSKKDNYMPGMRINAKQTIFCEGARGSLTESLKEKFKLDKDAISV